MLDLSYIEVAVLVSYIDTREHIFLILGSAIVLLVDYRTVQVKQQSKSKLFN